MNSNAIVTFTLVSLANNVATYGGGLYSEPNSSVTIQTTLIVTNTALPVTDNSSPYTGVYSPQSPLGALVGKAANGSWTLEIQDTAPGSTGTINSWMLELTTLASAPAITEKKVVTGSVSSALPDVGTVSFPINFSGAKHNVLDV